MFKLLGLAVVVFCLIINGVASQTTSTFSYSATSTDCTAGTFTCTLDTGVVDTILGEAGGKVSFLKGGTEVFKVTGTSASFTIVDGSANPVTGVTPSGGTATTLTLTFSSSYPLTSAQIGDWTCTVSSDTTTSVNAAAAVTIANTDLGNCGTTISINACSKTVTCDLGQSVTDIVSASGIINFKKAGTVMYKIATANTVTNDAGTAVTGLTAAAPVGTTAGGNLNDATLTFGTTFVTFDSATLDGAWTCDVSGTTTAPWYALASASTTLSTTCSGAINNQVAGLFVALLIAVKTLLF